MPVTAFALMMGHGGASFAQTNPAIFTPAPVAQPTPAAPVVAAAPVAPSAQPLARGNIYTLPLRAAPVPPVARSLSDMVAAQGDSAMADADATCLATAVYFESMGESLEGQLAVAQVVINRAQSGRYPTSLCGVVKQKAQFSFVRSGRFPQIDPDCQAWRKARAIARIAAGRLATVIPSDVLWYHADYVAPGWGRRLARVEKIGPHIFYRA